MPSNSKNKEEPEYVNFRKLLITRCQIEFEKNSVDENARNLRLKEIDECTDPVSTFSPLRKTSKLIKLLYNMYFINNSGKEKRITNAAGRR